MKKTSVSLVIAGLGAAAVVSWAGAASAMEGPTPYQPGISIGAPAGALPPPGFYFLDDNVIITGPVKDHGGHDVGVNVNVYNNNPTLIWSPNFQLFGAQYSTAVTQPYVLQTLNLGGSATLGGTQSGIFNTVISPLNLSWNLGGGLFAKFGTAVYVNDGTYRTLNAGGGVKVTNPNSIANNFWTIEPDIGLSWLNDGWNFTGHIIFDINTNNDDTHYQSGNDFYFDGTVAKTIGKFTVGAGFNITQQLNGDSGSGAALLGSSGKRFQYANIGPLFAYEVGPVTFSAKYLAGLYAKDGARTSFFHFDAFFPF